MTNKYTREEFLAEFERRTGIGFLTDAGREESDIEEWMDFDTADEAVLDFIREHNMDDITAPWGGCL